MSQLERLAKPFPPKYVKPPAQGKYGSYVDHEIVNQALLVILGPFSFRVEQVITNPDGIVDGCTASLTAVVDGREVTITEAGDCEHAASKKTQGDRLKNAASDALKRCAMRLGCGIHLWAGNGNDFFLYDQLRALNASTKSAEAGSEQTLGRVSGPEPVSVPMSAGAEDQGKSRTEASPVPSAAPAVPVPPSGATAVAVQAPTPAQESELSTDNEWTVSPSKLAALKSRVIEFNAEGASVSMWRSKANLPPLSDKLKPYEVQNWDALLDAIETFAAQTKANA